MTDFKITINGQPYDSPDAMPPDVRRTYEEAMRRIEVSLASGQSTGSTRVFTNKTGAQVATSVVVNRQITVNGQTYGSADELPPDARRLYQQAFAGAAAPVAHPRTTLHIQVSGRQPGVRTIEDSSAPQLQVQFPLAPPSTVSSLRDLPWTLGILIVLGLVLLAFLSR